MLTCCLIAGYRRRSCNGQCRLRDGSSESSSDDSEEFSAPAVPPRYIGSIPRLIITLDDENNQLSEEHSPETPGFPLELAGAPPRPIPVFSFTCEDFDEQQCKGEMSVDDTPIEEEAEEQSDKEEEEVYLPPQMRPLPPRLPLQPPRRARCTGRAECASACDCCRSPRPDPPLIPFIDEPNYEPLIYENDSADDTVATPKIRRIFPSLSLDQSEEAKPEMADADTQTPTSPLEPYVRKLDLNLDVKSESEKIELIHCRLRRALFNVSKSKSEETDVPSNYSTSESFDTTNGTTPSLPKLLVNTPESGACQVLDSRKSWRSPDDCRPAPGAVRALAKHFNSINLTYCVKNYKRNCQSSPNLSVQKEKTSNTSDNLQSSISLADIQYETMKSESSDTKGEKLSEDEVKSILIQLEDWSRFGSRGSEDTLAQGNEFEVPNLPSEEHTENNTTGYHFNEIVDKKIRTITLDNIKLKSNQSSLNTDSIIASKDSFNKTESLEMSSNEVKIPRIVGVIPQKQAMSVLDVSAVKKLAKLRRESQPSVVQSCPNIIDNEADSKPQANGHPPCKILPHHA